MSYAIWQQYVISFVETGFYTSYAASSGDLFTAAFHVYDYITVILAVVFVIGIAVTSWKLNTAPVFFIVTFILAAFLGVVSYFFNYWFSQLVSQVALSSAIAAFPRTIIICTNFHWFSLLLVVIGSITLYAKRENPQSALL